MTELPDSRVKQRFPLYLVGTLTSPLVAQGCYSTHFAWLPTAAPSSLPPPPSLNSFSILISVSCILLSFVLLFCLTVILVFAQFFAEILAVEILLSTPEWDRFYPHLFILCLPFLSSLPVLISPNQCWHSMLKQLQQVRHMKERVCAAEIGSW